MTTKKSVARVAQRARTEDKKVRSAGNVTQDSFVNAVAALGYGGNNQLSSGRYAFDYLTRNRTQLESMYRTSWIIRKAVDCGAEDMIRAGVEFEGTLPPDKLDELDAALLDFQIWQQLCDMVRWARLFGGCVAVMLIDGQAMNTPLRLDTIGDGQFKGLYVLDRWMVNPSLNDLITEFGPELGKPKYYTVTGDATALNGMKIHHSRVIRADGLPLPYYQNLVEQGWGESIIENIHDRVIAFDSTTMGAAQLAFKAHLRTLSIEGLRDIVATGGPVFEGLKKQIEFMRFAQSNEGLTILDGTDVFEAHSYTFAGLSDIILQMGQQLSGGLDIPLVRLFGQSPAGLSSTGESDLRTYYDGVAKQQEQKMRRPVTRLVDVVCRSLGIDLPKDFKFKFRPLWMLTENEKAEIAEADATSIGAAFDQGLISQQTAMKELKQSSKVSGRFSNITDKDIEDADDAPPSGEEAFSEGGDDGQKGKETKIPEDTNKV